LAAGAGLVVFTGAGALLLVLRVAMMNLLRG
jgi:hypothetical protein